MKALIVHHTLNECGGGEAVALHAAKALLDEGFEVHMLVMEKTNWRSVEEILGLDLSKHPMFREHYLLSRVDALGPLLPFFANAYWEMREKFDITVNTVAELLPLPADIVYLHYLPIYAAAGGMWGALSLSEMRRLVWGMDFKPSPELARQVLGKARVRLTNSKFTKAALEEALGLGFEVAYPPVAGSARWRGELKEDAVAVISRFSPEKNLHLVPEVAKHLPDVEFRVVGVLRPYYRDYYRKVWGLASRLGNVKLHPNARREEKTKVLLKSKIFLHLMPREHFGIAAVEAMAAGCLPVVHKSGGIWTDIGGCGRWCVGYDRFDPGEIAGAVEKALKLWSHSLASSLTERAMVFSDERFRRTFASLVRDIPHACMSVLR